jgi:cytochrome b subunit of formate dehydrogenase
MEEEKYYTRLTLETRILHILLLTTFILLVITGFALRYSHTAWAQAIVERLGGWEMRTHIHHISGITMVGIGFYHAFRYFIFRNNFSRMLPRMKDLQDFWGYIKHNLGAGDFPRQDHFDWKQKFEYWGVVWGTLIMGLTGFLLMFPFLAMKYIPYAWLNLAAEIHFYEALLATLVVFIWHFYNVHLNLEFPMQTSFISGDISEEMMKKEHALEYDRLSMVKEK